MFERVVIGYDGSPQAADALATIPLIAPRGTAVRVVYAARRGEPAAGAVIERARAAVERRNKVQLAEGDSDARTLAAVAADWPADLMVLGSAHRARRGHVGVGRVAEGVLHSAPCPLLIVPSGYADAPPRSLARIGVGFPRTADSREALRAAVALAERAGAELDVIDVMTQQEGPDPVYCTLAELDATEAAVAAVAGEVEDVEAEVPAGDAADILVERSHRLDLLVVGSRGYGPIRRLMSPSVSRSVLQRAMCPVLVLPHTRALARV